MAPRRPRRSAHAAHTGSARGTPSPRRNHGFAPRLQSGADAEAILSEAPVPAAEHKVGCTRLLSRAGPRAPRALGRDRYQPRLPDASLGLVATPVPPRPPRIRLRSDTRSSCHTPGHVPAPPASHSFDQTKGPRAVAGPAGSGPGAPDCRAKGGGGGHKAAFVPPLPARGAGETSPARRAGPAAPPPLPQARQGRGSRCLPRPTAPPQSAATGRLQSRSPVPSCLGPTRTRPGRRGADAGL